MVNYGAGGAATVLSPSGDTTGATDGAAIASALAAGKAVQLAPGTFWTNTVIQIPGFASLVGSGEPAAVIVKMAAGANLAAVAASSGWTGNTNTLSVNPAVIRGITFDANSTNQSSGAGHGVVLQTYASYIEDCIFQNTLGDGLRFDVHGANGTTAIGNTAVENRVILCQFRTNGGNGFNVADSTNSALTDGFMYGCIAATSTQRGINIDASAGWVVEGCHVYGTGFSAIAAGAAFETRIVGNYCEDWGTSATIGTYAGIDLAATYFLNDSGQGSAITGNTLNFNNPPGAATSTIYGIGAASSSGHIGTLAIAGNVVTASDNTHPADYTGVQLTCQSNTSTLNVTMTGNQFAGNWGAGNVVQTANGGALNLNELDSAGTIISNANQPAATIQTSANQAFTTALNVFAPNLSALTRDVLFNLGVSATTKNACTWAFEYQGVGSNNNNMKFNFFGSAVFFTITAGGIVSTLDNTLDNGAGASTWAGLVTRNGGVTTAGSAPILTGLAVASGTPKQLSDTTRDYMVYFTVTTAGTATTLSIGHTSSGNDVTLKSSTAANAGDVWAFRLPAGWWIAWSGTTTAIANQVAVGC